MNDKSAVEIRLNKSKLRLNFLGSIAFVGLATGFVINPIESDRYTPTATFTIGLVGILIFGYSGFYFFKKLFDKKPALIIADDGIVDNSSAISGGFIPWSDIEAIKERTKQKIIKLVVKNPQVYIDRQPNAFKRWVVKGNNKSYGTPILISANGLKYNYEDLKTLLHKRFQEYKSKNNH